MISVNGNFWEETYVNERLIQKLKQDFKFSKNIAKLLISRSYSKEEIYSLNNTINFKNPFKNDPDFNKSKKLILDFIKNKKKILIIGDYDVDGSISTSMLIKFFQHINHSYDFYIPDRTLDGYGLSKNLLEKLKNRLTDLVIIVDSGSKSHKAVNYLNDLKIKSIIIDHHEISKPFPNSTVLINPKKTSINYNQINLCASALVYFLIDILKKELCLDISTKLNLFLTALATICDVMPLRGLNRNIIIKAFKEYNYKDAYFINYLLTKIKKNNNFEYDDFGFLIGPILNSGGRLNKSNLPVNLIISSNRTEIKKISDNLIDLNNKRKEIEIKIINKINKNNLIHIRDNFLIIKDMSIPEGLIGIIATRFLEKFNKTTIVITQSGNILKGSARSISKINIGSIINNGVFNKVLLKGGGHQMAAGFTLTKNNFNDFKKYLSDIKISNLGITKKYVSKISSSAINSEFVKDIYKLAPFGNSNNNPIFFMENFRIYKPKIINKNHIFCLLKDNTNKIYDAIAFNVINTKIENYLLNFKNDINILCKFNLSSLKKNKINIQIVDIIT